VLKEQISGHLQMAFLRILELNLLIHRYPLTYSLSDGDQRMYTKISRHSAIFQKDQVEIYTTIQNSMQLNKDWSSQMKCIKIWQEKLHGKQYLELDFLKDGISWKALVIFKLRIKPKIWSYVQLLILIEYTCTNLKNYLRRQMVNRQLDKEE